MADALRIDPKHSITEKPKDHGERARALKRDTPRMCHRARPRSPEDYERRWIRNSDCAALRFSECPSCAIGQLLATRVAR